MAEPNFEQQYIGSPELFWCIDISLLMPGTLALVPAVKLAQEVGMHETNVMRFRARREEIIGDYRQRGTFQTNRAAALANDLRAFVSAANGAIRAQAQLELATILRMSGEFREAIPL